VLPVAREGAKKCEKCPWKAVAPAPLRPDSLGWEREGRLIRLRRSLPSPPRAFVLFCSKVHACTMCRPKFHWLYFFLSQTAFLTYTSLAWEIMSRIQVDGTHSAALSANITALIAFGISTLAIPHTACPEPDCAVPQPNRANHFRDCCVIVSL